MDVKREWLDEARSAVAALDEEQVRAALVGLLASGKPFHMVFGLDTAEVVVMAVRVARGL